MLARDSGKCSSLRLVLDIWCTAVMNDGGTGMRDGLGADLLSPRRQTSGSSFKLWNLKVCLLYNVKTVIYRVGLQRGFQLFVACRNASLDV